MHDVTIIVCQQLYFDVFGRSDKLLDKNRTVTESFQCLSGGFPERREEILLSMNDPHTASSSTCRSLQNNRKSDLGSIGQSFLKRIGCYHTVFDDRHIDRTCQHLGRYLVSQLLHDLCIWAYKDNPFFPTSFYNMYILAQETISRMDGINLIFFRDTDYCLYIQIRFQRFIRFADLIRFICFITVQRITVFMGKDGDSSNAHFGCCTEYAYSNLSPVRNHESLDRTGSVRRCVDYNFCSV